MIRQRVVIGCLLALLIASPQRSSLAADCTRDDIASLCAPATADDRSYLVRCDIDFRTLDCQRASGRPNVITRALVLEGAESSNLSLDFNAALISAAIAPDTQANDASTVIDTIEIRSRKNPDGSWSRPENIRLANAHIRGSLRVFGMGRNGEASAVRDSSHQPGHRQRVRAAAPRDIRIENIHLTGIGRNLVYLAPGVTRVSLSQSRLDGVSARVAIYLDAETQEITLTDNSIATRTGDSGIFGLYDRGWPQLALDGSSLAHVEGNRFLEPDNGGIYLYRNCGEGGTIRIGTPSHNTLINNRFEYAGTRPPRDPGIYIGSRNYGWLEEHWPGSHCDDDRRLSGRPVGSALSNRDHARNNRIEGNRFMHQADDSESANAAFDSAESTPANPPYILLRNPHVNTGNELRNNRVWRRSVP